MQKQKTLAASFSLKGKGLHTGLDIEITFNPAPENHGYKINVSIWKANRRLTPWPRTWLIHNGVRA